MQQKRQIVFDLDGTLIDSSRGIMDTLQYTFHEMGMPPLPEAELRKFIGPPLIPAMMSFQGMEYAAAERALTIYRRQYRETGLYGVTVYDGVPAMLDALRAAGYLLHVATSKPEEFAKIILENIGLLDRFTEISGATMDESRTKKAEVLEELFRRRHIAGREALAGWYMVGDRIYDMEGAAAFGMQAVGAAWGFGEPAEFRTAAYTAATPADLVAYFTARAAADGSLSEKRK